MADWDALAWRCDRLYEKAQRRYRRYGLADKQAQEAEREADQINERLKAAAERGEY